MQLAIPADSEINIIGTTRRLPNDFVVALEPSDVSLPAGLLLCPSLSKVTNGTVNMMVANCSSTDIILTPPTRIAKITACEVIAPNVEIQMNESEEAVIEVMSSHTCPGEPNCDSLPFNINKGDVKMSWNDEHEFKQLFHEYSNIFSLNSTDMGFTDNVQHRIHTTDEVPVKQTDRRIPPQMIPEALTHHKGY